MLGGDSKVVAQQLRDLSAASQCFKVKGGGHVIALFGVLTDAWLGVGAVRLYLLNRGVCVHRDTVRTAMKQLTDMGVLEAKASGPAINSAMTYRRKLNEAARELKERQSARDLRGQHAKRAKREFLDAR